MATTNTMCMIMVLAVILMMKANGQPQVPCFFIFGDSLSDSGNNNNLATIAKGNYLPYGIDFPGGPTGRFTNGRTTVDLIGDHLGLDGYIPSFPDSDGEKALKGVNYASASSGILPNTGYQVGQRIDLDVQLKNHQTTVSRIASLLGSTNATSHLGKCVYSVYIASNDWMIGYFDPLSSAIRLQHTPQAFADLLLTQLSHHLTTLHDLGARKVVLFGVGPLGCLPLLNTLGTCTQFVNSALEDYNNKLRSLADSLNTKLRDSKFIYINTIGIIGNDLSGLGLKVNNIPCCQALAIACAPSSTPCADRDSYAYWDQAHPTEAANKVLASRAYSAKNPDDAYPIDIARLAKLQL